MHYPGGKGVSGTYQRLINQIPPHRVYIETHLGGGAVMRHKQPAEINIGVEVDGIVIDRWRQVAHVQLVNSDATAFLRQYRFHGDEFIYADPPYLAGTRRSERALYRHDYTEAQHRELLQLLVELPCKVMVSGYRSGMYEQWLGGWRSFSFPVRTRSGGWAEEWVWMNYPEPEALHDYRYLGESFRERERIRRMIERWKSRLSDLPALERNALLAALRP